MWNPPIHGIIQNYGLIDFGRLDAKSKKTGMGAERKLLGDGVDARPNLLNGPLQNFD